MREAEGVSRLHNTNTDGPTPDARAESPSFPERAAVAFFSFSIPVFPHFSICPGPCEKTCSVLMRADILYMNGRARRY